MSDRMPYIIGNWKMNLDIASAMTLASDVADMANDAEDEIGVGVAIPYLWIPTIASEFAETSLLVGAQDISPSADGAYTGDISGAMLAPWCTFVLVGHSERRQGHDETNSLVHAKLNASLAHGMAPVLCVGETQAERDAGHTLEVITTQITTATQHLTAQQLRSILIAYEPVWAIGTGLTATPDDAQTVAAHIRAQISDIHTLGASLVPILYGGSVKGDNASGYFACPDIDGALVGGASLSAEAFFPIVQAALG